MSQQCKPRKSLIQLAEDSGLFDINASDLVCEASDNGIYYYNFVMSVRRCPKSEGGGKMLYLAKFDKCVNLELFESAHIPAELFDDGLPAQDVGLMTLAVLIWKNLIGKSKILCLVDKMEGETSPNALEALKRATYKFSASHHVQCKFSRRPSTSSVSSYGSGMSYHTEGMKMRVLLCPSTNIVERIPAQAVRETKALLNPSSNPILCLCFPLV